MFRYSLVCLLAYEADEAPAQAPLEYTEYATCPLEFAMELNILNLEKLAVSLRLKVHEDRWHVTIARPDYEQVQPRLGNIRPIGTKTLKCACNLHPGQKCELMINAQSRFELAEALLVRWLCSGVGSSAQEHKASREKVKAMFRSASLS